MAGIRRHIDYKLIVADIQMDGHIGMSGHGVLWNDICVSHVLTAYAQGTFGVFLVPMFGPIILPTYVNVPMYIRIVRLTTTQY